MDNMIFKGRKYFTFYTVTFLSERVDSIATFDSLKQGFSTSSAEQL